MTWKWKKSSRKDSIKMVWECSSYSDLTGDAIDFLRQYGQPFPPESSLYRKGFKVDWENVIVQMKHFEVMKNGYGKNLELRHFPIVKKLIKNPQILKEGKKYSINDVVKASTDAYLNIKSLRAKSRYSTTSRIRENDRKIPHSLYSDINAEFDTGSLASNSDAAYVHGTVQFALFSDATHFRRSGSSIIVKAEVGVFDDNWDYESSSALALAVNNLYLKPRDQIKDIKDKLQANTSKKEKVGKIDFEFIKPGRVMDQTFDRKIVNQVNDKRTGGRRRSRTRSTTRID